MKQDTDTLKEQDRQQFVGAMAARLTEFENSGYLQALADVEAVIRALRKRRQAVTEGEPPAGPGE